MGNTQQEINMIDLTNISGAELKRMKAEQLDESFQKKYPNGQYGIHLRGAYVFRSSPRPLENYSQEIYIQYKRRTSHTSYYSPVVAWVNNKPERLKYVNNSWGFVKYYDNEKDFLEACDHYNIPKEMVLELLKYNEEFKKEKS